MPGIDDIELFILVADESHDGFCLRQGADMIFRTGDIENGTGNVREIYRPPTQFDLSFHQFVLLVELANPLLKGSTGEWYTVVHPFIHSQPGVHGLVLHDAIPHRNIGTDIVGDRVEHTISGIDEFRWNIAKRFYHK